MNAIKERAQAVWDGLISAMRQDGIIATCVTQSGPATTAQIVQLVTSNVDTNWMAMGLKPQPGRQVLAQDDDGNYHIAWVDDYLEWFTHLDDYLPRLQQWRYIESQL